MNGFYRYKASVVRIVDGDTVDIAIDLGLHIHSTQRCRLFGLNAPEVRGPERTAGRAATVWLTEKLKDASDKSGRIEIETHKDKQGKYGRYLVTLFDQDGNSINDMMITAGHAKAVNY